MIINGYLKEFDARMRDTRKFMKEAKGKEPRKKSLDEKQPRDLKKGTYVGIIAENPHLLIV